MYSLPHASSPFVLHSRNMTGSNIPFDFLHEQGIEFDFAGDGSSSVPITSSLPASTSGRLDEHEDLELSSSLLTMSLDKDIPMDEMALSAGEKSLLARPMAEDLRASSRRATCGEAIVERERRVRKEA